MLVLLLACTDVSPLEAAAPRVSATTWQALAAPTGDAAAGSAKIQRRGALRFADSGPIAADGEGSEAWHGFPVVEADAGVRVVDEVGGVRLLPWLDRDDLVPVVAEGSWLDGSGRRVRAGAAGVYVPPGREVLVDAEGVHVSVSWPLQARLALPESVVDEWYLPAALPALGEGPEVLLLEGARLLDDHGDELASVGRPTSEAVVLERAGHRALVEVTTGSCGVGERVRAWVDVEDMDEDPEVRYGRGYCCGFGMGFWGIGAIGGGGSTLVPPGRLLWDAPDGDVVGVVTGQERPDPDTGEMGRHAVLLAVDAEAGEMPGWTAVRVRVNSGVVTVWARDAGGDLDDLEPPEAE